MNILDEFKFQVRSHARFLGLMDKENETPAMLQLFSFIDNYEAKTMTFQKTIDAALPAGALPKALSAGALSEATQKPNQDTENSTNNKKRKRVPSELPPQFRCLAKLEDGERCPRKKSAKKDFCSVHKHEVPFGVVEQENGMQNVVVTLERLEGIDYYIDTQDMIYSMEAIKSGMKNPPVIGKKVFREDKKRYQCQLFVAVDSLLEPVGSSSSSSFSSSSSSPLRCTLFD